MDLQSRNNQQTKEQLMQITAITKYKHGGLYGVLKRLGWNQSELARKSSLTPQLVGKIINLHARPTADHANKIQAAVGLAGEFLDVLAEWPEAFSIKVGYKAEQTADIELERLIDCPEVMRIQAPEQETDERLDFLSSAVAMLPYQYQVVINNKWGLDGEGKTYEELGK